MQRSKVSAQRLSGRLTAALHASVPPRVDYELTELGQTLLIPLGALADWANTHRGDIQAARDRHDRQVA
jgi:DNA-binding HxlR family transcriptional regulator